MLCDEAKPYKNFSVFCFYFSVFPRFPNYSVSQTGLVRNPRSTTSGVFTEKYNNITISHCLNTTVASNSKFSRKKPTVPCSHGKKTKSSMYKVSTQMKPKVPCRAH